MQKEKRQQSVSLLLLTIYTFKKKKKKRQHLIGANWQLFLNGYKGKPFCRNRRLPHRHGLTRPRAQPLPGLRVNPYIFFNING